MAVKWSGFKFVRTAAFDKTYDKLDGTVQDLVLNFLQRIQMNPDGRGLNLKLPEGAKDDRVRTARVNDNFRAVMLTENATCYLVGVFEHDKAYKVATNLVLDVNMVSGGIELLDLAGLGDSVADSAAGSAAGVAKDRSAPLRGVFDAVSDADLVRLGVNAMLIPALRELRSEDAVIGLGEVLPKLAYDVLLCLVEGKSVEYVWENVTAPAQAETPVTEDDRRDLETALERPATLETFVVSHSVAELQQSLLRPFEEWRIFLHPEQRKLAYRDRGPYHGPVRVTGGPGTGKTVVALHRVAALLDRDRGEGRGPILLTTFTTTLAQQLERLLKDLVGAQEASRVTVLNIDKVASRVVKEAAGAPVGAAPAYLGDNDIRRRWDDLLAERPDSRFDAGFLNSEWSHVVLAQGIQTRAEYFAARRRGRGRGVNRMERAEIWELIEEFERRLSADRAIGYKQLAANAARIAEAGLDPRRRYNHIVVDEAQDLHAAHWRLLRALAPEGPDDLFIVGDTHQRIYDSKVALSALGIDIKGRSYKLKLNYRTTRQILSAAAALLDTEQFDDLDGGADDLAGYRSILSGGDAKLSGYRTEVEELRALVEQVAVWKEAGILPREIMMAARTNKLRDVAVKELESSGHTAVAIEMGKAPTTDDRVHVMTMHRAKGLEYRAVMVIGVGEGSVPLEFALPDQATDPAQYAEGLRAECSLLFVAATRAREALTISWHGKPSRFLTQLVA